MSEHREREASCGEDSGLSREYWRDPMEGVEQESDVI